MTRCARFARHFLKNKKTLFIVASVALGLAAAGAAAAEFTPHNPPEPVDLKVVHKMQNVTQSMDKLAEQWESDITAAVHLRHPAVMNGFARFSAEELVNRLLENRQSPSITPAMQQRILEAAEKYSAALKIAAEQLKQYARKYNVKGCSTGWANPSLILNGLTAARDYLAQLPLRTERQKARAGAASVLILSYIYSDYTSGLAATAYARIFCRRAVKAKRNKSLKYEWPEPVAPGDAVQIDGWTLRVMEYDSGVTERLIQAHNGDDLWQPPPGRGYVAVRVKAHYTGNKQDATLKEFFRFEAKTNRWAAPKQGFICSDPLGGAPRDRAVPQGGTVTTWLCFMVSEAKDEHLLLSIQPQFGNNVVMRIQ